MQCPETSAPSPSKIQNEVNSALPTSSKRRRLVSEVWNDFKRVEVDGEHRAICNHCLKHFSGSSKSGTTHLKNHLSRCSAIQSGESSKQRRLVSKVWNDFKRVEVDGECRALCTHCHKHFSGSSKSGTTHLKNHLSRCSAIESPTLCRTAIPRSTGQTGARIEGEDCSNIQVALIDALTGLTVISKGDFDGDENDNRTVEEFKNNIVREREGKKPLLTGDAFVNLKEGTGFVSEISFVDNSSCTRSSRFRLGARVVDKIDGTSIREAKTESFTVRDHRGELYKKHHPPSLLDEVWRLEKIGKDGAFHKRLSRESINTVKDFLTLLFIDPARLRNILGTRMSAKMWEVTVEHAQTCVFEKRMFLYSPPSSQQKTGVVFNVVGQVMGLLLECHYVPIDKLSETEKADAHNLVMSAFEHWGEVVSFDDEASIVDSSSHLTNVLYTASSPRTESSNGCKFLASHKIGGFDYAQQSASSPDIISSIYSVGGSSGLEDFALHGIDSMGLRYEQNLSFPESMNHSFDDDLLNFFDTGIDSMGLRYEQALSFPESMSHSFDDDHLNFFDTDLLAQSVNLEPQSDLQSAVDNFMSARAIGKAQRWTKLFSVLKWFSIRVAVRKRVREIARYKSGL